MVYPQVGYSFMWGIRVVVPTIHQPAILQELHRDHPGQLTHENSGT